MKRILSFFIFSTLATFGFTAQNRLNLNQPNGGNITYGNYYDIKWDANFNDMIDIFIYQGNTEKGKVAVNVPAANHLFRWKAGYLYRKGAVHGQGFKIKIVARNSHLSDMSDSFFAIVMPTTAPLNMPQQGVPLQKKIISPDEYNQLQQMNSQYKPDLVVSNLKSYVFRNNQVWEALSPWINERIDVGFWIKNIFPSKYGNTKNHFKVKVQFRYGYSGPVHKEKIVWIRKFLAPGEEVMDRVAYGKVKSTPDVLCIKVIADSENSVIESNENNNSDDIEIRIVEPNPK